MYVLYNIIFTNRYKQLIFIEGIISTSFHTNYQLIDNVKINFVHIL